MKLRTCLLAVLVGLACLVSAAPASAKKLKDRSRRHENERGAVFIGASDRIILKKYLEKSYFGRHCPPGLAKKRNRCLPPGQAKKYVIGRVLPHDVVITPLPREINYLLRPPRGYYYAQADQDVVLIAEATRHILDAVTLLSAVR